MVLLPHLRQGVKFCTDHERERGDERAAGRRDSADVLISARPEKSSANDRPGTRRAQRGRSRAGFGFLMINGV